MRVPTPRNLTAADGLATIVIAAVILAVIGLFWGWIFMVIAGICGWHIPLCPVAWAIGVGIALLLGARK